tara:strand:+ start:107 stop:244 length:138 start_codon:yes stop_codon:yes gene_type:complete
VEVVVQLIEQQAVVLEVIVPLVMDLHLYKELLWLFLVFTQEHLTL